MSVRIDRPEGEPVAVALFAHCFTCNKDIFASRAISSQLAAEGIVCVRFDFTGLGSSEGEFASTDFSSNVDDLVRVADALRETIGAPQLLVGHSLGGAAVLVAAPRIPEVKAVATIGAPADAEHVTKNFEMDLSRIQSEGEAAVKIEGRPFTIRKSFLDDLESQSVTRAAEELKAALLVMHAPRDERVGIENATRIFLAAHHPKSFVSLDDADHLLKRHEDGAYVAGVIAAWAARYIETGPAKMRRESAVARTAGGPFRTDVRVNEHPLRVDEPIEAGGENTGPTPYDLLSSALAACSLMTMRLYAERKGWTVDATVSVDHGKVHKDDCAACADVEAGADGRVDRFDRHIVFGPGTDPEHRTRLVEIANRCPVHRTLERGAGVVTTSNASAAVAV
nr:alpha/beta fold hydrolase [Acuticoccus kalidii]